MLFDSLKHVNDQCYYLKFSRDDYICTDDIWKHYNISTFIIYKHRIFICYGVI